MCFGLIFLFLVMFMFEYMVFLKCMSVFILLVEVCLILFFKYFLICLMLKIMCFNLLGFKDKMWFGFFIFLFNVKCFFMMLVFWLIVVKLIILLMM